MERPKGKAIALAKAAGKKPSRRRRTRSAREAERSELGKRGKDAAAMYLTRRGYEVLERDWECYAGSVDIIACDDDAVVFVEVRTAMSIAEGFPSENIDKEKRAAYEKTAAVYFAGCDLTELVVRFDIMGIIALDGERVMVRHHINAFSRDDL